MKLNKGEVLAFKTDTVWGFGCNPDDNLAIDKIYQIKHRDLKKPLILMSNDFNHLKKYVKNIPDYAYDLIKKHLPGGLTLIFEKSEFLNNKVIQNGEYVGIRIPNSKDFSALIDSLEETKVLATTSCNITNEEPVKNYLEANEKFKNVATIIKPIENTQNENLPSTVIMCNKESYKILRQGAVLLNNN